MALNITKLQDYIKPISKELATKAVVDATTAKLLIANKQAQFGIKGSAAILKMDADINLQDGSTCGTRNPLGNQTFSDKKITVVPIKDETNICPKTLYNSYFAEMVASGQNPEQESLLPEFAKNIMEYRASKIAYGIEKLIWHGDTSLTGTNQLKYIDGLVKQITAGSTQIDLSAITGSTIVEKLQAAFLAMPVEVRTKQDFRIFIGQDTFAEYTVALANKNIFKPVDDMTLFGTTAILEVTSGLNGTREVVAARISNFHLGMDMQGEEETADLKFSIETNQWYQDFHFAVGVSCVYPAEVGYVDLA